MKTFIWNTEYQVFISNAPDLKTARLRLHYQFTDQSIKGLIDEKDKDAKDGMIPSYVLHRAYSVINADLSDFLEVWEKEPDYILEDNQAVIYDHSNE